MSQLIHPRVTSKVNIEMTMSEPQTLTKALKGMLDNG